MVDYWTKCPATIADAVDPAILIYDYSPNCCVASYCDHPNIDRGGSSEIHARRCRDCSVRFYGRMNYRADVDDPSIASICRVPKIRSKNPVWAEYCVLCRDTQSLATDENLAATDEADETLADSGESLVDSAESSAVVVCSGENLADSDENLPTDYDERIPVALAENRPDFGAEIVVATAAALAAVLNASSAHLV